MFTHSLVSCVTNSRVYSALRSITVVCHPRPSLAAVGSRQLQPRGNRRSPVSVRRPWPRAPGTGQVPPARPAVRRRHSLGASRHPPERLKPVAVFAYKIASQLRFNVKKIPSTENKKLSCCRRLHYASCHWICFEVTQGHWRSFEMTTLSKACVSPIKYSIVNMSLVYRFWDIQRLVMASSWKLG